MDKKRALWIYSTMNRIRKFEEKALQLFENNKLRGSVHLYIGEEAIAATVCSHMTDQDYITSTHRGHGHAIAKGATLDRALAELMGKATGYCKGRGGSMHIADLEKGNMGANAIVAGGVPIAVGGALAQKMKGEKHFTVAFFGDGASNQGTVHGVNFLRSIGGGLVYTCGLSNVGNAFVSPEEGVDDIFHGRLRFTPAENTGSFTRWENDDYVIGVHGEMRDASLFKDNLVLARTVSTTLNSKSIQITDTVENQGFETQPMMLTYHMNFGYPLVREGCEVWIPSCVVSPMNPAAEAGVGEWDQVTAPIDGYDENVFVHALRQNADGKVIAGLYNPALELGVQLAFDYQTLPYMVQWKCMRSGDYVLGIFPSNNHGYELVYLLFYAAVFPAAGYGCSPGKDE